MKVGSPWILNKALLAKYIYRGVQDQIRQFLKGCERRLCSSAPWIDSCVFSTKESKSPKEMTE